MNYEIEFTARARKDLAPLPVEVKNEIGRAINKLKTDMAGDVKKLKDHFPSYRLRVAITARCSSAKETILSFIALEIAERHADDNLRASPSELIHRWRELRALAEEGVRARPRNDG
ncbi:MAG TPA: hypothetical protein VFD13_01780 [Candidatus Kapabacteria bacterium]|nr:hypothetical protein [Candidatus Kapabacteria bacterium]